MMSERRPQLAVAARVNVRMVRALTVTLLIVLTGLPASASADAPREARIVEGLSMADVPLNSKLEFTADRDEASDGPLSAWGKVRSGFCFEGTNCRWRVSGGGAVDVILNARNSHIRTIATTSHRWRTAKRVGPGSSRTALKRAYGRRILARTTCGLNGFGGTSRGYVLNTRKQGERRFTFFALTVSGTRVARIWIGRGRAAPGANC